MDPDTLKPGVLIFRHMDIPGFGKKTLVAEVVRVNRVTVTVRNLSSEFKPERRVKKSFLAENYELY